MLGLGRGAASITPRAYRPVHPARFESDLVPLQIVSSIAPPSRQIEQRRAMLRSRISRYLHALVSVGMAFRAVHERPPSARQKPRRCAAGWFRVVQPTLINNLELNCEERHLCGR